MSTVGVLLACAGIAWSITTLIKLALPLVDGLINGHRWF